MEEQVIAGGRAAEALRSAAYDLWQVLKIIDQGDFQ
jgi:hypothetical protein